MFGSMSADPPATVRVWLVLVATNLYQTSLSVLVGEKLGVDPTNVPFVEAAPTVNATAVPVVSLVAGGADRLKADEAKDDNDPELKVIVAPVTAAALVAVRPLKVAVPLTAATVVVPPRVQVPCVAAAVTFAVLVVTLL